jgi:DNA primase
MMGRHVPEVIMNYDPDAAGQSAIRRSIDLLLEKSLRVRILRLPGALDPDDFIRKEGPAVYSRLLDTAPYFWQYLVDDAGKRFDLSDPSLKAAAVREVMDHVVKIQDRIEQLEVGRAVAEAFKLPETVILERLNAKPRRPELKTVTRTDAPRQPRRLPDAERQLIQALGQDDNVSEALQSLLNAEFWNEAWSRPVLDKLIRDPRNTEAALDGLQDQELAREVRSAMLESVGPLTVHHAFACVQKLYDAHLVKKEREIRIQLEKYGPGPAPADLLRKHREIVIERRRVAETLKARG